MQQILKTYQRRLTNLSGNNRSLLLLRLNAEQFLDLHDLDYVNGEPSWNLVDQIISRKSKVKLIPIADARDEKSNKLSTRLKKLQRREQFIFQESGARDLYVGWPFVEGKFNDGTNLRAPLCFFPVELDQTGKDWILCPKKDVNISFNKSLLLAFAHYNQIDLADELVEFTFDGYDKESTALKNMLYEQLRESAVDLQFSREFYGSQLESFAPKNKEGLEFTSQEGEVSIKMQAVLGIFPQADSYLVPDYDFMLDQVKAEDLDQFFESKSLNEPDVSSEDFDPTRHFLSNVNEYETFTPFALDAYQENALNAVKKGNSIVVQGPPGTGKSQLICNLISDFIARGKKVLVVSQKRAALDVVYERLKSIKAEDFATLVHDFKADRKTIYDQLANQIEQLQDYKRSNTSLDALQLDRAFKQASLSIEDITESLDEYKKALFDTSECGLSIKELYLTSSPDAASIPLVQEYSDFHFNELKAFKKDLCLYFDYAKDLNVEEHPWSDRVSFAAFGPSDLQAILNYIDEILEVATQLKQEVGEVIGEKVDYDDCRTISENLNRLEEIQSLLKTEDTFKLFRPMVVFGSESAGLLWLQNTRKLINTCFADHRVEQSIPANEIGEVQGILKQRSDAKNTFWKSLKWRFSKEKLRLARILVANNLRDDKAALRVLTARIDNRLNLQHQLTKLKGVGWIEDVPQSTDQNVINDWLDQMEQAINAKTLFDSFANFKEFFPLKNSSAKIFGGKLKAIGKILKNLPDKRANWNKYVLPRQIDIMLADAKYADALRKSVRKDFDVLIALDKIRASFTEAETAATDKIIEHDVSSKEEALELFDNSIRLAWINHIENKYPVLADVSTLKFQTMVDELQQSVFDKAEASASILLQRTKERTYEGLEFNRLNNQVTYRDLKHQVTKKRKIWPLRRLISNFEHELFNLVPCWLASPEAVSAIFPMESFFDLVIFDEASQCFTEKGLPAIYRGKQVVIAGDSQQLRPNDLYRVRWEDEQEEMALEVDSLLELANNHLMQVDLKGHYRSRSMALIDFSNQHFYKGKLRVLPDFKSVNDTDPAIEYIKVEGQWEKQTNSVEADRIVALVKSLQEEENDKSIGIVTFNAPQQALILDRLEEAGLSHVNDLFVKNIENVQGDERDIIIFSTAYAPNAAGKLSIQFGSLNQVGGENRLNVAVTRAKERVIMVTSILPTDLKVDHVKNEGPKLLRAYLEYAHEVSSNRFEPSKAPSTEFGLDWYLKRKLQAWENDLPVSFQYEDVYADLSIKLKEKYLGLLFTDDDYFYNSLSSKEVFAYRPAHMKSKNWPVDMILSREYWMHKEKTKDKLKRFVEQISDQS
ncbi:hypothetical protein BFP97_11865 [Roseivirga sp. 4D4]|uniref:AAA domain-containing protein n=1 Tax=Roseivirga sp. 4D4 TaxID=1889784 RepID=UPI000853752D|nr:AAA domain-containing protein [Roseivirga sp. 4D4]OEK02175.1 hypothetical protein BFP97_11865 [Roseivirga sp. 4D4]